MNTSHLILTVKKASGVFSSETSESIDPYLKIEVKIGEKKPIKFQTKMKGKTQNPVWEETFIIPKYDIEDLAKTQIKFNIFDWDLISFKGHSNLGMVLLTAPKLQEKIKKINLESVFEEAIEQPK